MAREIREWLTPKAAAQHVGLDDRDIVAMALAKEIAAEFRPGGPPENEYAAIIPRISKSSLEDWMEHKTSGDECSVEKLKAIFSEMGVSMSGACKMFGVSRSGMRLWFLGKRMIKKSAQKKIMDGYRKYKSGDAQILDSMRPMQRISLRSSEWSIADAEHYKYPRLIKAIADSGYKSISAFRKANNLKLMLIYEWIWGKKMPSAKNAIKVAEILGEDVRVLFHDFMTMPGSKKYRHGYKQCAS